jgi:hydroxymethylpyrimidine pyrophosphatase-like HAD family hydrolase
VQFVEITGVDVSKATTLQHICTEWGIQASEVVAFGDNNNDIDMLRWAGHGVAVANATDAVRLNADEVIGHHDHDSVAEAIERVVATTLTS